MKRVFSLKRKFNVLVSEVDKTVCFYINLNYPSINSLVIFNMYLKDIFPFFKCIDLVINEEVYLVEYIYIYIINISVAKVIKTIYNSFVILWMAGLQFYVQVREARGRGCIYILCTETHSCATVFSLKLRFLSKNVCHNHGGGSLPL